MNCESFPPGDCHKACPRSVPLMWLGAGVIALIMNAGAQPPKIDLIQPFLGDRVLIHFDTDANLNYELQYTETLTTNGVPGGTWTNLFVAPLLDSPSHYVVVDTGTRKQRFYRLHVYP